MKKMMMMAAAVSVMSASWADDIAKWDPRMAANNAVVDTSGVKWIDGKYLPIEGRWTLGDMSNYYCRLPDTVTTKVNGGVRSMRQHTSGMLFRFKTDSKSITIKFAPLDKSHGMYHMTEVGTSGWDMYRRDPKEGKWLFVTSSHVSKTAPDLVGGRIAKVNWIPGDECIINLPLYNGVREFYLGIDKGAKIEALGPRANGIEKPVVFYGTSITHGGCSTRPGLGFVNIIGRQLDVPVFGLGFSGSGWMEYEMSEHLSRIDASCYVLDCIWNMDLEKDSGGRDRSIRENYEKFIRNLRTKRPGVPIVMAEQCDIFYRPGINQSRFVTKHIFIRSLYEKLIDEGWEKLYYLPAEKMYSGDTEGTVDGCHPNDLGMMEMAAAYGAAVREALGLDRHWYEFWK